MNAQARSFLLCTTAALLAAILVAACASTQYGQSSATVATPEDQAHIEEAQRSIAHLQQELDADRAAAKPDCRKACELAANICDLASRTCGITSRYPATDPMDAHCANAHHRCQLANGLTNARCGCDKAR